MKATEASESKISKKRISRKKDGWGWRCHEELLCQSKKIKGAGVKELGSIESGRTDLAAVMNTGWVALASHSPSRTCAT